MNRVLLVGINPSGKPFRNGCSLDRMNLWMNSLGHNFYSFSNVIPYEGEYKMSHVDFNFVKWFTNDYEKVIALGGFVSKVLKKIDVSHYTLPHPSPLNRKLNSKKYELACLLECREWLAT